MCKVIAVSNQKGGVGKTVSCVNLGIGLAQEGKKVLLIDADPQGSLTISLGYEEPDEMEYSLATLMLNIVNDEKLNMEKTILHHKEGVDLIPANIELSAIEVSLVNAMSRELIMRSLIERLREFYDFIIIDCMPSLGMMTINALACADSVLIPVQAAYLPVKGLQQLIKTIGRVKKQLNPKLRIEGILLTIDYLYQEYPYDREMLDGILELILDIVCSKKATIVIAGDEKSINLVKSRFMKLDMEHIRYVMNCMQENTTKIRSIKQYLLAALYNAPATIGSYYRAEVNHDMAEGKI